MGKYKGWAKVKQGGGFRNIQVSVDAKSAGDASAKLRGKYGNQLIGHPSADNREANARAAASKYAASRAKSAAQDRKIEAGVQERIRASKLIEEKFKNKQKAKLKNQQYSTAKARPNPNSGKYLKTRRAFLRNINSSTTISSDNSIIFCPPENTHHINVEGAIINYINQRGLNKALRDNKSKSIKTKETKNIKLTKDLEEEGSRETINKLAEDAAVEDAINKGNSGEYVEVEAVKWDDPKTAKFTFNVVEALIETGEIGNFLKTKKYIYLTPDGEVLGGSRFFSFRRFVLFGFFFGLALLILFFVWLFV